MCGDSWRFVEMRGDARRCAEMRGDAAHLHREAHGDDKGDGPTGNDGEGLVARVALEDVRLHQVSVG